MLPTPFTPEQEALIIHLYTVDLLSIGKIADAFDQHNMVVREVLVRHDIPRRKVGGSKHTHPRAYSKNGDSGVNYLTNLAIARGELQRQPCEHPGCGVTGFDKAGRPRVEAHHDDYNHPYQVRWLCPTHHAEWHTHNQPIPASEENRMDLLTFTGVPGRNHSSKDKEGG